MIVGVCECGGDIPFHTPEKATKGTYGVCMECGQKAKLKVVTVEADE